jgi:hypothetical protein
MYLNQEKEPLGRFDDSGIHRFGDSEIQMRTSPIIGLSANALIPSWNFGAICLT